MYASQLLEVPDQPCFHRCMVGHSAVGGALDHMRYALDQYPCEPGAEDGSAGHSDFPLGYRPGPVLHGVRPPLIGEKRGEAAHRAHPSLSKPGGRWGSSCDLPARPLSGSAPSPAPPRPGAFPPWGCSSGAYSPIRYTFGWSRPAGNAACPEGDPLLPDSPPWWRLSACTPRCNRNTANRRLPPLSPFICLSTDY